MCFFLEVVYFDLFEVTWWAFCRVNLSISPCIFYFFSPLPWLSILICILYKHSINTDIQIEVWIDTQETIFERLFVLHFKSILWTAPLWLDLLNFIVSCPFMLVSASFNCEPYLYGWLFHFIVSCPFMAGSTSIYCEQSLYGWICFI